MFPEVGCLLCLHLLAQMRSAQMEAGALSRDVVNRIRNGHETESAEKRALEAYDQWDATVVALNEHIRLHPRIPE